MENRKNSNKNIKQKIRYNPPKLNLYGSIANLTTGGSGIMVEMKAMTNTMKKP